MYRTFHERKFSLNQTKNHHFRDGFLTDSIWVARHCHSWLGVRVSNSILINDLEVNSQDKTSMRVSENETNETVQELVEINRNTMISKGNNNNPMRTQNEQIESFKKLWKKEYDVDLTDAQAFEYSNNLLGFFKTLLQIDSRMRQWNERLKNEPKGFAIPYEGTYNCCVCQQYATSENGWYDQYGIKCLVCQKAVEDGTIPGTVCSDKESWWSVHDLKRMFSWYHTTTYKKARAGELKARIIKSPEGANYYYVFLKAENLQIAED